MKIGKYRFVQMDGSYAIYDTSKANDCPTAITDEFPTVISSERMERLMEDLYCDYLE